jgi:hypothetical protein
VALGRFVGRNTWDGQGKERTKALGSIDGSTKKLKSLQGNSKTHTRTRQKKVISGRGSYRQKPPIAQTLIPSKKNLIFTLKYFTLQKQLL